MNALLLPLALAVAQPNDDWKTAEAAHLKNIKQVTFDFVRAGEGYFSPDGKKIIFQAEEKGTGNPFYQIFVKDLVTGKQTRVSPGLGRTTCGYFRPDGKKIIFASQPRRPGREEAPGGGDCSACRGCQERGAPPLFMVLRPAHEDLRGQPRR